MGPRVPTGQKKEKASWGLRKRAKPYSAQFLFVVLILMNAHDAHRALLPLGRKRWRGRYIIRGRHVEEGLGSFELSLQLFDFKVPHGELCAKKSYLFAQVLLCPPVGFKVVGHPIA
jgi:hypothetical protein